MSLGARKNLKARMSEEGLLIGVGARDALEARLIDRAGFDFVWSSSFDISAAHAVPDASLLSMTEYLDAARWMNEAIEIPVLADCDTGFGNVNNVVFAVQRFEDAGVAGACIEDKKFPKDTSLLAGGRQDLVSIEEFTGKIRAAVDARRSPDFVVVGRVEALIAGRGEDEALERAERYAEAGADAILIHSKARTPDEVVGFVRRWSARVPLVLIPTNYPTLTEEETSALGGKVKMVIYANQPVRAAVKAVEELLAEIKRARGIHTIDERMVPVSRIFELQDVASMKAAERKYLR
jgi:phosphoenolpyruvate phosphomutase